MPPQAAREAGARAAVAGLATPYPLVGMLPAVLQEDQFVARLTAALDEVLAPIISVLDCLDAYVDPWLAPTDFLEWLAGWVGSPLDDNWEDSQKRASVAQAAELHRMRGTTASLRSLVELATGGQAEVYDPGGTSWSQLPTSDDSLAGETSGIHIRVHVPDPGAVRLSALDELVAAAKPAHVPHQIEVV